MVTSIPSWLPSEAAQIVLVLFLSFLVGLEREEHATEYAFGGVRTFPLIGLLGYGMAVLAGGQLMLVALGFLAVAGFLLLSYWHKLTSAGTAGVTSELSALATYLVGALVYYEHFWIATTLSVASLMLLELKTALENLSKRIPGQEIFTFTKFLLLTAVILPILPNRDFTRFHINPFKTWLVVVAVSTISYGSYVVQRMTKAHAGLLLTAILGGAYSSTVTSIALARYSKGDDRPRLFSAGILMASGVMYLRLAALVSLFSRALMATLAPPFLVLAALGCGAGWLWSRRSEVSGPKVKREFGPKNPLELGAAFLFAGLFLAMLVATHFAAVHLGRRGVYGLAAVMGVTDVDPFIMGITQAGGASIAVPVASAAILIAAASNNLVKGIYAFAFAPRDTGRQGLGLLLVLAALGLVPLLWMHR